MEQMVLMTVAILPILIHQSQSTSTRSGGKIARLKNLGSRPCWRLKGVEPGLTRAFRVRIMTLLDNFPPTRWGQVDSPAS